MDAETPTPEATDAGKGADKSATAKLVVAVALATVFVVFAVQNLESIEIEFLAWSFNVWGIVLMVASAAAGIIVWEFAGFLRRRNRRRS